MVIGIITVQALGRTISASLENDALREEQRDATWDALMLTSYLAENGVNLPPAEQQYASLNHEVQVPLNRVLKNGEYRGAEPL